MQQNILLTLIGGLLFTGFNGCYKASQKITEPNLVTSELALLGQGKMNKAEAQFVVSNAAANSLSYINADTRAVAATQTIPGSILYYIVYLPLKDKLFVTDQGHNSVQVIDPASHTVDGSIPVGTAPMHMVGQKQQSKLWVVNNTSKSITEINANNLQVTHTLQLDYTPHDIAVNANGTKIYVSLNKAGTWYVNTYSTNNYNEVDSRGFGSNWLHLFYSQVNDRLYAADQGLGKFWSLDPDDLNSTSATSVAMPGAHGLTLSADEKYSYIASMGTNMIYVYDNSTNTIISQVTSTVSPNAHNVAVDQAHGILLATHSGAASTSVSSYAFNNNVLTQGSTITVGTNPQGITYFIRKTKD
ncbi:MAG: YncE family protein [Candidatus Dadabacteria bacterium]